MKRLLAALLMILVWAGSAGATATPVLSWIGYCKTNSVSSGAALTINTDNGSQNCQIPVPGANHLWLLLVQTESDVGSITFSGTGCTGGYWTAQSAPSSA